MTHKEKIKQGDRVRVLYISENQGTSDFEAVVILTPAAGEGDLFQIEDEDGEIRAINPYHWAFCEMRKIPHIKS